VVHETVCAYRIRVVLGQPGRFRRNRQGSARLPGNIASDEDQQIMREAIVNSLENQPDNITTGWKNPLTGSHGIIRPVETYEKDGMHCRKLRLRNNIDEQSNEWMFNFCKTPEGDWKIAP
jgi:surface antigen